MFPHRFHQPLVGFMEDRQTCFAGLENKRIVARSLSDLVIVFAMTRNERSADGLM